MVSCHHITQIVSVMSFSPGFPSCLWLCAEAQEKNRDLTANMNSSVVTRTVSVEWLEKITAVILIAPGLDCRSFCTVTWKVGSLCGS